MKHMPLRSTVDNHVSAWPILRDRIRVRETREVVWTLLAYRCAACLPWPRLTAKNSTSNLLTSRRGHIAKSWALQGVKDVGARIVQIVVTPVALVCDAIKEVPKRPRLRPIRELPSPEYRARAPDDGADDSALDNIVGGREAVHRRDLGEPRAQHSRPALATPCHARDATCNPMYRNLGELVCDFACTGKYTCAIDQRTCAEEEACAERSLQRTLETANGNRPAEEPRRRGSRERC